MVWAPRGKEKTVLLFYASDMDNSHPLGTVLQETPSVEANTSLFRRFRWSYIREIIQIRF